MDVGNIAELNTFLLLDAIRSRGEATRRQLGRELGLSDASVSRIVKRLLATGIIEELPGEGAMRGRTPSILRFVGPAGGVIAVDLGGTRCHGALADLAGGTLATDYREPSAAPGDRDAAGTLLRCIEALKSAARDLGIPVRAVVVGIPALIDPVSQLAVAGPNVHWQGFDLLGILRDRLSEPFEVDNDVNLAALGEAWRGQGRGIQSFVTMSLGTGIGGAVVIDGHLVRGSHNAAGEVGYFPFWRWPAPGPAAPDDRQGFEEVASGPALRARAATLLTQPADPRPGPGLTDGFSVADVFAAAARGDALGLQVVGELTTHVAAAITGVTALVDPERVILDGAIGRALEPWLPGLRDAVAARVFRSPDIVVSGLGPDAAVTGAIARALALVSEQDAPAQLTRHVMRRPGVPAHRP
ncbi:MAG TPA: ROK family transcriptional regulator [Streptosporangiaceae bacterium]|nr:ROK family transcriptional regulator [Streptosporangiaceae bacterium]